jgi:hypothetical protein
VRSGQQWRTLPGWIGLEPLAAVILWGGIYPGAKIGLAEIPPLVFTYLSVVLAVCVLALAAGTFPQRQTQFSGSSPTTVTIISWLRIRFTSSLGFQH